MSSDEQTRSERAAARSDWPIRRYELGEEPSENLIATTTPEERLGMMWELALQAWSLTGRPLPEYERHEIPGRVVRPPR